LKGRITRLVGDQQLGVIAGDDGVDYLFESLSLFRTTFASLRVGTPVTFVPNGATKRATVIRTAIPEIEV